VSDLKLKSQNSKVKTTTKKSKFFQRRFIEALTEDLNFPRVLAEVWNVVDQDELSPDEKIGLLLDFDRVLGLDVGRMVDSGYVDEVPREVSDWLTERERLREEGRYDGADEVRKRIEEAGYEVEDTSEGPKVRKKL
jgi:cysteinyl-tRNA synthetase